MKESLKLFFKIWLYFIGFALGFTMLIWGTVTAGNYNFFAGLLVFLIGLGGIAAAAIAIALR
jgi:hypothetical protein